MHETVTPTGPGSPAETLAQRVSNVDGGQTGPTGLTGPGVAEDPTGRHGAPRRAVSRRGWRLDWRGGILIGLALAVVSGTFGLMWWGGTANGDELEMPIEGSADAGFLRDMIVHHDQAVAMSFLMRDRSTDNLMDAIATDIILNQLIQIGMLRGYLNVWDLPANPPDGAAPPMAWMGHPTAGLMPGMATPDELQSLRTLPLAEAEVLFLRLMIRHHVSGIEMAQAGLARVASDQARELAETVIPVQFAEIQLMQQELFVRGADAEPTLDASGMTMSGGADMDGTAGMDGHEMGTPTP